MVHGGKIMISVIWGFLGSASGKEPTCLHRRRDAGVILGSGRSPGGAHGTLFQNSCLGNPMDRGAWQSRVDRVTELDMTEAA